MTSPKFVKALESCRDKKSAKHLTSELMVCQKLDSGDETGLKSFGAKDLDRITIKDVFGVF